MSQHLFELRQVLRSLRVRRPVESGIAKQLYRQTSQSVCPWNARFSAKLPNESPYTPREVLEGSDVRTGVRELLGVTRAKFSAAFRGSPTKRAKPRGLKHNAAVVLGNVGTAEDVEVLTHALGDPEPPPRGRASH